MNDTLLAFMKRVSEDTELRAQVDGLKGLGPEDMAARAAAIAQDAGFELSAVGGGGGGHAAEGCICVISGVHGDSIYYCVCLAGGQGTL